MSETVWKDDSNGVIETAGSVGGDIQVGEAYSRRFVHSRLAGRAITVEAYPIRGDGSTPMITPDDPIRLEVRTELMVATNPDDLGSSEVWSEYENSDLPEAYDRDYATVEAAELAAMLYLKQLDPALHFTWDGRPEMGPASVLKYGEMLGKLAHEFSKERLGEHHSVHAYVQRLAIDNNAYRYASIQLDYWYERVTDPQGNVWLVAWLMDVTNCLGAGEGEGGWVIGVYWEPVAPTHMHYDEHQPPYQVGGSLLSCSAVMPHNAKNSELWAEYRYDPRLERSEVTGLPGRMERDVTAAYRERKQEDIVFAITDVMVDEEYTYRVTFTNRTGHSPDHPGPVFHTEEWGLYPDGKWHGIPVNPHPGYEHWSSMCPNCGY